MTNIKTPPIGPGFLCFKERYYFLFLAFLAGFLFATFFLVVFLAKKFPQLREKLGPREWLQKGIAVGAVALGLGILAIS